MTYEHNSNKIFYLSIFIIKSLQYKYLWQVFNDGTPDHNVGNNGFLYTLGPGLFLAVEILFR